VPNAALALRSQIWRRAGLPKACAGPDVPGQKGKRKQVSPMEYLLTVERKLQTRFKGFGLTHEIAPFPHHVAVFMGFAPSTACRGTVARLSKRIRHHGRADAHSHHQ
jgi:hypothetical protein